MTNCILKSVRNKNKLYETFLIDHNSKNEQLYKNYKNRLNHIIKMAKKNLLWRPVDQIQTEFKNGMENT